MKIFILLVFMSILAVIECAPVAAPEANPEPCLEIIFRALQLFLTTSRPRRREYTTPYEDDDDEPEPTTEATTDTTNTDVQPTTDSSGESADGPSVDESATTTEKNPDNDDTPNEIIPKEVDTIRKLRKANKKRNNWWFSGIKF